MSRPSEAKIKSNSNIVSAVFGASVTTAVTTITALVNDAELGNTLSTACSVAFPVAIASPLVSYISGPDCAIKAKPFAIGTLGGLALTFCAATFDHYNPEETQQQTSAIPTITAQRHSKIA